MLFTSQQKPLIVESVGRTVDSFGQALSRANGKPDSGQVHSLVLSFRGFFREGFAIFLHCPMFRERLNE